MDEHTTDSPTPDPQRTTTDPSEWSGPGEEDPKQEQKGLPLFRVTTVCAECGVKELSFCDKM